MARHRLGGGGAHAVGRLPAAGQHRQRLPVAALAAASRPPPGGGSAALGVGSEDGGAGLGQRLPHGGSCSPASACSSGRQGRGVARAEHRLRRLQPRGRVGAEQGQAAQGRLDGAPDAVVDPHRLQRRRHEIGGAAAPVAASEQRRRRL